MAWTAEKIAALPIGPQIDFIERVITPEDRARGFAEIEGRQINIVVGASKIQIPKPRPTAAMWAEEDDVIYYVDADGIGWSLGRYADGEYFRRRVER